MVYVCVLIICFCNSGTANFSNNKSFETCTSSCFLCWCETWTFADFLERRITVGKYYGYNGLRWSASRNYLQESAKATRMPKLKQRKSCLWKFILTQRWQEDSGCNAENNEWLQKERKARWRRMWLYLSYLNRSNEQEHRWCCSEHNCLLLQLLGIFDQ